MEREQHRAAGLERGPGVVAVPCPPRRPPVPGCGEQRTAPALFIFPAAENISCQSCLLAGAATGQRAAVWAGAMAHAVLPLRWAPAGSGTAPVPTHVPPGMSQGMAPIPRARCEGHSVKGAV